MSMVFVAFREPLGARRRLTFPLRKPFKPLREAVSGLRERLAVLILQSRLLGLQF